VTFTRTGLINQQPLHGLGCDCQEVRASFPIDLRLIDEFHVRLMHQCGGLQHMIGPLSLHVSLGQIVQLGIDKRQKVIGRPAVAISDASKKLGSIGGHGLAEAIVR
jgi:hypothetical protein